VNVCENVPLVMSISVLASAVPRMVLEVLAERTIVGDVLNVVQAGALTPAETNTCPEDPAAVVA
jgi:hypothetical protein